MTNELRPITVEVDAYLLDRMVDLAAAAYDWQDRCIKLGAPERRQQHNNLRNAAGELLNALQTAQRKDKVFQARALFWAANPNMTFGEINDWLPLEPVKVKPVDENDEAPEPMHSWSND